MCLKRSILSYNNGVHSILKLVLLLFFVVVDAAVDNIVLLLLLYRTILLRLLLLLLLYRTRSPRLFQSSSSPLSIVMFLRTRLLSWSLSAAVAVAIIVP